MAKVHINTDDCEEIARRLSAISGSLTGIAGNIRNTCSSLVNTYSSLIATKDAVTGVPLAYTAAEITAATVAARSSPSAKKIDSIAEKLKKASNCIYQSIKLYNSAEKNVSGFENWLVDEELRKLNQTKKDALDFVNWFINDNKETFKQSPYRMYLDGTWFITPITQVWDHVVRVDGEDVLGLMGVDSESEEIILRMCQKKELSLRETVGNDLLEGLSTGSEAVSNGLGFASDVFGEETIDELIALVSKECDLPFADLDHLDYCLTLVQTAANIGAKEMAYNVLLDTVAFKSLRPLIRASGDRDLLNTYYLMEEKLNNDLLIAEQELKEAAIDEAIDMIVDGVTINGIPALKLFRYTADTSDLLFRTSDTAEAHNLMLRCKDISDSLAVSVNKALSAYNSSPTPENYASLMNAAKAHFEIEAVGNQYAYELYEAMDKAWIKKKMTPEMMRLIESYRSEEERIYNNILHVEGMQDEISAILQLQRP